MIVKYFSEDGREFSSPEDCRAYEAMLKTVSSIPKKVFTDFVKLTNESGIEETWYSIKNPLDLYYFEILDKEIPPNVEDVIYECLLFCKPIDKFPFYIRKNVNGKIISLNKMLSIRIQQMNDLKTKLESIVDYVEQITGILNPVQDDDYEMVEDMSQEVHTSVLSHDLPKDDSGIEQKKKVSYRGKKKTESEETVAP